MPLIFGCISRAISTLGPLCPYVQTLFPSRVLRGIYRCRFWPDNAKKRVIGTLAGNFSPSSALGPTPVRMASNKILEARYVIKILPSSFLLVGDSYSLSAVPVAVAAIAIISGLCFRPSQQPLYQRRSHFPLNKVDFAGSGYKTNKSRVEKARLRSLILGNDHAS